MLKINGFKFHFIKIYLRQINIKYYGLNKIFKTKIFMNIN